MARRFHPASEAEVRLVLQGITDLMSRTDGGPAEFAGHDPAAISVEYPHLVYDLSALEVLLGHSRAGAQLSSTRYLVLDGSESLAAVEVRTRQPDGSPFIANVNFGPFAVRFIDAVNDSSEVSGEGINFEVTLLRCSAIGVTAIWWQSSDPTLDRVRVIPPAPVGVDTATDYRFDTYMKLLQPLARNVINSTDATNGA